MLEICYSEGPEYARSWRNDCHNHHQVQQKQMQNLTSGEKKNQQHAVEAGADCLGSSSIENDLGVILDNRINLS